MSEGRTRRAARPGGHQVDAPREWMPLASGKDRGGEPRRGGPVLYTKAAEPTTTKVKKSSMINDQKKGDLGIYQGFC